MSETVAEFRAAMIRCAREHDEQMQDMTPSEREALIRVFLDLDDTILFAVWPDQSKSDGFEMITIKGIEYLYEAVAFKRNTKAQPTAILCASHDDALALRQMASGAPR